MKIYLDPVYLALNDDAWQQRIYFDIFELLNKSLKTIEEIEESLQIKYKLVRFKFNEELFSEIYNHNPFKNEPQVQEFYINTFSKVLSDLARRFDWCPTQCIVDDVKHSLFSGKSDYLPENVLRSWIDLINQCAYCSLHDSFIFFSHATYKTIFEVDSQIPIIFIVQEANSVFQLFLVENFFLEDSFNEDALRQAIYVFFHQSVLSGRMTSDLNPQEYGFHAHFLWSLEDSQVVKEDDEFKIKFIDSLTQVVYAKDIDIRTHKYGKITIQNKKYDKYSADLYKMGRGTNDRRCSRIFYCKIKNQICFYEFDPDFHESE